MRNKLAAIAVAALLAASAVLHAQSGEEAQQLEPITVKPQINPLDDSMERLRRMMADPYCDGCPPLIEVDRRSIYNKTYYGVGAVLSFLSGYGEKPPEISPEDRAEGRVLHDWRMYERDPER